MRKVYDILVELRDGWSALPLTQVSGGFIPPSNSELRRWLRDGAIFVNGGRTHTIDDVVYGEVTELVIFPKGEHRRTTLR